MKRSSRYAAFSCLVIGVLALPLFAAAAAQKAGAQGSYVSSSHDEIVSMAKKEGKLRILTTMDDSDIKANTAAFKKKYPFLDVEAQQSRGTDSAQRLLLEIKSGMAKEWDVVLVSADFYSEYHPYLWKANILEMAKKGVLQIPAPMIDPRNKNVIATFSYFQATAYNSKLIPANLALKHCKTYYDQSSRDENLPWIYDQKMWPGLFPHGAWKKLWISRAKLPPSNRSGCAAARASCSPSFRAKSQ